MIIQPNNEEDAIALTNSLAKSLTEKFEYGEWIPDIEYDERSETWHCSAISKKQKIKVTYMCWLNVVDYYVSIPWGPIKESSKHTTTLYFSSESTDCKKAIEEALYYFNEFKKQIANDL